MNPIVVIGEGGHGKVIQDIISIGKVYKVIAILDDKYTETIESNSILFGPVVYAKEIIKNMKVEFIIAIGNNDIRKSIADSLTEAGVKFAVVIHPAASVSPTVHIDEGTVVMAGSVINADVTIGRHAIINSGAIVEHDNRIGNYVHISPGVILTGNVEIGEGSHIGAGATVIPGKKIGDWSIIGASATVIDNIPNGVTALGLPAKVIKNLN
ncbi:acetyltransferase [Peribacillus simplex]|uniref:acetyltransferase n=1 Tax=Peribacillus simplex TaxID=1478 RepID=UPI0010BED834|nr:acetyltransferase [Peribacillus simplex]TKH00645.1 acetyltransferase [Peribacillus simplex]